MGVSFKISKTGTRFKPKPLMPDSSSIKEGVENSLDSSRVPSNNESNGKDEDAVGISGSSLTSGRDHISAEDEVSFILNLYPDKYSIVKPSENDNGLHATFQEGSKMFLPYDRTSEGLFAAIESGRLPGGILDDILCKYVEGAIICEIRDYRKCMSDIGANTLSMNGSPTVTKLRLKMTLENVVKDIPLMAGDNWTYGDLMEVESRILKALQPKLCLDPTPKLDRLSENPVSIQLKLGLAGVRKRRLRQMPEVIVTSSNRLHGKKVCIDRAPESSSYRTGELGPSSGDVMSQQMHTQDNAPVQGPGNPRNMHDPIQGASLNISGASPAGQDMSISYTENINPAGLGKMEGQEGQLSPYSTINKRARLVTGGSDITQQQQIGSYMDSLQGPDALWRSQLLQPQQNARGIQYANSGMQKYPQLVGEGVGNQDGVKLEKPDANLGKSDMHMMETESGHIDPRLQHRLHQQQSFMRPAFQQAGWTSVSQQAEKDPRKEDQFQKRKSIQSPRLSAGTVAQSAKSAEISGGSMGAQYGGVSSAAALGQLQREKSALTSIPAVERTASMTSSANDSMQPQHQAQLSAKRRSNSFSKNQIISGVGSPASVNTMGGPMNASSPSVNTPQLAEPSMIERFAKIEVVAKKHKLNCKKNKVDEPPRRPRAFPKQELSVRLSTAANNEYVKDETCTKPMSKSLVGGSMNICKIRVLNVQPERTVQGNVIPVSPSVRTRMIMSEKPNDGTVAMHYGELEDGDYLNAEDYLPTLPNTHSADLLAAQFCALMIREGYYVEDHVQPRPPRINIPASSGQQPNTPAVPHNNTGSDMQQYSESASGQQAIETKPVISNASMSSNTNLLPNPGMLPPGNPQALQMSQGLMSGGISVAPKQEPMDTQQPPQQLPLQNQPSMMTQQQLSNFQRSSLMLPTNSMPQMNNFNQNSNLPLGNMGNKPSPLQLLQQQQQQQQQASPQMHRRVVMGFGSSLGIGNIGNSMSGLGGLGNIIGARGMGGTGMSAPAGPMGANMGQNPMNSQANAISQHIRAGALNQQQAAIVQRMKIMQSRMMGGTQSGVAGISGVGARQMQAGSGSGSAGLSMLGQTLNRVSPIQRTMLGQMGQMGQMNMPKLANGMNVSMSQHQQMQLQHLQQQMQQQPQPQQMQQQEATSPLQAVVSPQQVGSPSPSTLGIPQAMNQQLTPQQQQASPQQMAQRTPMSPPLSSGPMHPMSAGNPEACPASPALSSQTLGSVGSITNSPMDLQGVNKSNSVT